MKFKKANDSGDEDVSSDCEVADGSKSDDRYVLYTVHSISVTRDRVPNLSTGYLLFSPEFQYSCLIGCLLLFKLYKSF